MNKGYHITLKSNLPRIYKNGLTPMIGKRSSYVGEFTPLLCFTNDIRCILEWKRRLYQNVSSDDLVILSFDLDGIEYVERYDRFGDLFTKETIYSDRLSILEFTDDLGRKLSIDELRNPFQSSDTQYIINESALEYSEIEVTDEDKRDVIEKLASCEHKKWSQLQDGILWTSDNLPDGSKMLDGYKLDYISKYLDTEYDNTDEIYKNEIRERIKETLFIILESPVFDEMGVSIEELISVLERAEHDRSNRWTKYTLSQCNENHVIPKETVDRWSREIKADYSELSEDEKESDRNEVYYIINRINELKSDNVTAKM